MNSKWDKIYSALRTIKNNYGDEVVSEPVKVKNLLFDFVSELMNEAKAFSNVLCDADINRYICEHKDIQESYIITRIENNMGLSSEWARHITKGLIILANNSELNIAATQGTDATIENRATEVPIKRTLANITLYQNTTSQEQKFLNSGFSRLSAGLWQLADEDFDKALEISSNPRAYLGKMMVALQIKKEKDIIKSEHDIQKNPFWILATEHATGSYKHKLQNYAREHQRFINTTISDKKPIKHKTRKKRTRRKKDLTVFWGYAKLVIGCAILIAAIVFGLYAWFADTGLTTITYYSILAGISFLGMFFLLWFMDFEDLPGGIGASIIVVIGIVVAVSIIGLIGDWIIKLI